MAELFPTDGVLINTAPVVDNLSSDIYLIGYRGAGQTATLVAVPATLFSTSARATVAKASVAKAVPASVEEPSAEVQSQPTADETVAVSLEELFDEAHNQYKDCWVQFALENVDDITNRSISVVSTCNVEVGQISDTLTRSGRKDFFDINTGIKGQGLNIATLQVSQIAAPGATQIPYASLGMDEENNIHVYATRINGCVNLMFKAPLTTAQGVNMVTE